MAFEVEFSKRLDLFGAEIFAALNDKKVALEAQGKKLYNLSVGTPDFEPMPHIKQALCDAAMVSENWKYSLRDLPELLNTVCAYYKRRFDVDGITPDQIMSFNGSQDGMGHMGLALLNDGDVVLLQNVRFNPEETSKDPTVRAPYAKKVAALGEVFVSDGFGVVHRAQGSDYDVAADLPAAAGLLVEKEVKALSRATVEPERPLTVVLGGSKVSDKLGVIENLLDKANRLVIGGGMVYTFLKAKGLEVGTSLLEEDQVETVKGYIERAEQNGVELVLPTDIVVNPVFPKSDEDIAPEVVAADAIPADKMGLDIGPDSQKLFHDKIVDSKTVVWNGPMGVFEVPAFAAGTEAVAQGLVDATAAGAFTIVGGGDSASAVRNLGFPEDGFSHISTGGGASLEFLEGKELPGLKVLD